MAGERQREMGNRSGRLYGSLDGGHGTPEGRMSRLRVSAHYRVEKVKSYQKRQRHGQRVGANKMN